MQRGHNFACVDEVDSILVDEARTPLIISGPADQATKWYGDFAKLVQRLKRGEPGNPLKGIEETGDYEVDEKKRTVGIHESGVAKVEDWLGIDNLYESVNTPLVGYLNNAIKAKELFKKDRGLRRHRRRSHDRRRAHRPYPRRPPLQRGHAPGDRGEGRRPDQGREPDPRHDHPAELLPPLRQAVRHDRYGHDRGRRVPPDLQAGRRPDPDEPADGPQGPVGPDLPHRGGEVRGRRRRHRGEAQEGPADPRRHDLGREVRVPVAAAVRPGHPARGPQRQEPRA